MITIHADDVPVLNTLYRLLGIKTGPFNINHSDMRNRTVKELGLSEPAIKLAQSTLARGAVLALCRQGGWRTESFLSHNRVLRGRLWERHPNYVLHYSPYTMQVLLELTYPTTSSSRSPLKPITNGDDLISYLVIRSFHTSAELRSRTSKTAWALLARSPLAWLAGLDYLVHHTKRLPQKDAMASLVTRSSVLLEALQSDLSDELLRQEDFKAKAEIDSLLETGRAQFHVLNTYLRVLQERRDLARYLYIAAAQLAKRDLRAESWRCQREGIALRVRAEADTSRAAFLRTLGTLENWRAEHAQVHFFDDEFEAAQLCLENWALLGNEAYAQLKALSEVLSARSELKN